MQGEVSFYVSNAFSLQKQTMIINQLSELFLELKITTKTDIVDRRPAVSDFRNIFKQLCKRSRPDLPC